MKSALSRISISLFLASMSQSLLAANLQALDVAALPGDKVELKLTFDEPVAVPKGYTIEQPARIALDLPGVSSQLGVKNRELGVGNARSVTVVEAGDRTRLIVNLTNLAPYNARAEGNNLFVVIGEGAANSSSLRTSAAVSPVKVAAKPYVSVGKAIKGVDFQRGEQGAGNVVIDLSDPSVSPDIQDQGGKITLTFPKTQLPDALRVRLDVKDFATPVQFVNAQSQGDKATVSIEPTGLYDYLAYQADNKLIVSVKPLSKEEKDKRQAQSFTYSGEKLSLNFQSIDVRSVLQLIADFTDLNLVASDSVQGEITLRLQNVPWDQALDLVLKTKGLDKRKVGNVLLVAPADEIAARERQELEAMKQVAELAPLRQDFIQLNYAKASDIAKLFENKEKEGKLEEDVRGRIISDDRTNTLIVTLTQERIDEIRRVVAQLDIPVRQVMIEARIVEASVDYSKELGVKWKGTTTLGDSNFTMSGASGRGGAINLGATAPTSSIGIGFITDNTILDLELSAMEKSGNGEIVSQPKVVTSDKETAKILKGTEIPYQESSSSGATTVAFKEAALSLEVTPQITPDNRVIMEVKVTKDEPDYPNALLGVPPIKKNEVDAKVLVSDGETIVIGGVFSNTQTKSTETVPFLGELPYLGRLFRRDIVTDKKNELLIFLTPRILNSQAVSVSK